jgi:WXG100 family type VII secretion target
MYVNITPQTTRRLTMGQISVTPEQLKQQAQVYTRSKEEIEQAIQKVNQMNSTIAEQWKGQAFQAYLEQYNQLEVSVKKFEELLVSINEQLNKYADTILERDAQDAQSFGF